MARLFAILRITLSGAQAYLGASLGYAFIYLMRILLILTLFRAFYGMTGSDTIAGYAIAQVGWALVFVQAINTCVPKMVSEISQDVKSGKIAVDLLLPMPYLSWRLADGIARAAASLVVFLAMGLALGGLMLGGFPADPAGWLAALALLPGALALAVASHACLGLAAFFVEDAEAFRWIYDKMGMVFAGNILPVPFLPAVLQGLAVVLPFMYAGYAAGLQFARFDGPGLAFALGAQAAWTAVFVGVAYALLRRGTARLELNGG